MRIFHNKFLISFLILTVLIYAGYIKIAEAKGSFNFIAAVVAFVVAVVVNVVCVGCLTPLLVGLTITDTVLIGSVVLGQVMCLGGTDNVYFSGCGDNGGGAGGGGGGASVGSSNKPLNCWQINSTMYIPQLNGSGYNNQCALPLDETQSQIAIYRYSIPNSSSQSALNDWYLNQIKTKVGNGYLVNGYHTAATEEGKIAQLPYSQLCSGNVCKFSDDTVPDNSYVAYGAKIIGNYYKNEGGSCSWPNKFLNKDNAGSVTMSDTYKLGNGDVDISKTLCYLT